MYLQLFSQSLFPPHIIRCRATVVMHAKPPLSKTRLQAKNHSVLDIQAACVKENVPAQAAQRSTFPKSTRLRASSLEDVVEDVATSPELAPKWCWLFLDQTWLSSFLYLVGMTSTFLRFCAFRKMSDLLPLD